jgi:type II secretory pathway pseudopilin PulG
MTLAELAVTMMLLGIVLAIILSILFSVQRAFGRQQDRSISNDQARLAVQELDRELRSGNLLYEPTGINAYPPGANGMQLVIYTQTNATTRNPGNRCVQWKITGPVSADPDNPHTLQRRDWSSVDPLNTASDWRIIAEDVVNNDTAFNPGLATKAFALDHSQTSFGDRIIKIDILVNHKASSGKTVEIQDSVTGRNTQFGYPTTVCDTLPPG